MSFYMNRIYELIIFIISISVIHLTDCFNLENRLPIIKYGDYGTYFGYSLAMHTVGETPSSKNPKWILVGAPLGKNLQPQTNHSGALFKCPITQKPDDCQQVMTDGRRYKEDGLMPPIFSEEIKEDQWLGVTVRSQGLDGKVLVCAHRYITKKNQSQHGQGLCYILTNDLNVEDVYQPCRGRSTQRDHEDYGYCQVGTSGALLDDNTMVLGSPGPYTWRGTIFATEIGGEYLDRDKNIYYGDHLDDTSPVDKYSYLGMAVTGGRYFGDEMSYAAGAPRSNGHGQVVIFTKSASNPIPVKMIIEGEQFASSFGYELITADINGDQEPDLIVAAPFYFNKTEGGAVYIYQNSKANLPSRPTLKLTGATESQFGLAMANIGDLNQDHFDDIAIGAPYEGNGVVYIYLGSQNGLSKKPSQIIRSSDLGLMPNKEPIKTFGSVISGGTDLDSNSYPDIAIGAYGSSAAVILLSRPIINIRTQVRGVELQKIDPNKKGCEYDLTTNLTCISFEACCSIESHSRMNSENSTKPLNLMYIIEAETFSNTRKFSRVVFNRDSKRSNVIRKEIQVKPNTKFVCRQETAYIKENTRNIQSPIKFRLNFTIVELQLPTSALKLLNPILDQSAAEVMFEGTFQKDCGMNDLCESNLQMTATVNLEKDKNGYSLVLGESDELRVHVTISNQADSAYEAQLFFVHQKSVTYIAPSKNNTITCNHYNDTVVSCNLGNPMRRNFTTDVSLRFDPRGLADNEQKLSFKIFANTTSEQFGPPPVANLDINIVKKAGISIRGWVRPEQSFYGGVEKGESAMEHIEDIGSYVTHTYQIYNDGPWKAPNVTILIEWPHQVANDKEKGKWLLYLEDAPVIEGTRTGECFYNSEHINPLNLTKKTKNAPHELAPESYMMRPTDKSYNYHHQSSTFRNRSEITNEKSIVNDGYLNRLRRDTAKKIRPEHLIDNGKYHNVVVMDCEKKTAICVQIKCFLYNMTQKTETFIHIKARLWNSTLVSDYSGVDLVKIVSRARVKIPTEYIIESSNFNDKIMVVTKAYPELKNQTLDSPTPILIIILSALGGLILLAILAVIMWKCGFFKRRRPDPTLSGNLEKSDYESKPFIPSKGGK